MEIMRNPVISATLKHLAVIVAYVVTEKLVLSVFVAKSIVSIVWPPSGIALAVLLLGGKKYIPALLAGVYLAGLWTGKSWWVSMGVAVGCTLEACLAAFLLLRVFHINIELRQFSDYFYLAITAAISSVFAAVIGAGMLYLSGYLPANLVPQNALHWWQGDLLGMLLVTPLILVWKEKPQGWLSKQRFIETLLLISFTVISGQIIFLGLFGDILQDFAQSYWVFLLVIWAALRFGRHGVLLVITVYTLQNLLGIFQAAGLVESSVTNSQLQNFWFFSIVLVVVGLTLALIIDQRERDRESLLLLKENAEKSLHDLSESEDRHRLLFENSKDALMINEPVLTTFSIGNREAIKMFGVRDEAEFRRYGPLDFSPEYQPDGQKSVDKAMMVVDEAVRNGSSYFEWTHKRMNGEEFPCSVLLTAITINGKVLLQAAIRDITLQKQAEKALHDVNQMLEGKVQERTQELVEAKQVAEVATQEKSSFLANMSHEIRIPISSVLGMSYLALNTSLNKKQRDYIEKIQLSAQHLLNLIDSVLDLSKLDAGQVILESINFNLDTLFTTLRTLVQQKALGKGLKIEFFMDPALEKNLRGDPLRLTQILVNYVNNAIKFSEKGNIEIRIKELVQTATSYLYRFEVVDEGIGIPLDDQSRLFESFQQGDSSTTRKYGGTGLGLAISKQLAGMMGGEVGFVSEQGKGSTFWFTAWIDKASPETMALQSNTSMDFAGDKTEFGAILQGKRVLLAEDNDINQQVAAELLELVGMEVIVANNGLEAIELLQSSVFDCVLMDVQMPVMNGIEATQWIRANPQFANTLIIAMTANAWNEDQEKCRAVGMNDFISKPVKPHYLYATIAKWLGPASPMKKAALFTAGIAAEKSAQPGNPVIPDKTLPLLDLSILAQSLGNNIQQLREFVATKYIDSTQLGINEMKTALQLEDINLLRSLGHKYKSSAKTVGALAFAELCLGLEQLPDTGYYQKAKDLVAEMQTMLLSIAKEVK